MSANTGSANTGSATTGSAEIGSQGSRRRWWALAAVSLATFMTYLDS